MGPSQLLEPTVTILSPTSVPKGKKIAGNEVSFRLPQRSNHNSNSNSGKYVNFTVNVFIVLA